jgi:hypothetical protein
MDINRMRRVVMILDEASLSGHKLPHAGYFEMQHDIIYIPWRERVGRTAEELDSAGCHWDEEAESWASF